MKHTKQFVPKLDYIICVICNPFRHMVAIATNGITNIRTMVFSACNHNTIMDT